jgi:hypothetical protein
MDYFLKDFFFVHLFAFLPLLMGNRLTIKPLENYPQFYPQVWKKLLPRGRGLVAGENTIPSLLARSQRHDRGRNGKRDEVEIVSALSGGQSSRALGVVKGKVWAGAFRSHLRFIRFFRPSGITI